MQRYRRAVVFWSGSGYAGFCTFRVSATELWRHTYDEVKAHRVQSLGARSGGRADGYALLAILILLIIPAMIALGGAVMQDSLAFALSFAPKRTAREILNAPANVTVYDHSMLNIFCLSPEGQIFIDCRVPPGKPIRRQSGSVLVRYSKACPAKRVNDLGSRAVFKHCFQKKSLRSA